MASLTNKLLLVDGSNLAFRMFYALESTKMSAPDGRPSWAIFGFFKALLDVIEKEKPTQTVAVFDSKEPTFRHEAFDYYKANRPTEMPEELSAQWGEIQKGLALAGINVTKLPGYEADDIIGTFAVQAGNQGWETIIFSGDKDVLQLVDANTKVLMPGFKGIKKMDRDAVIQKLGVAPEQVINFKALCGDSSDNIPGIKGVGEKTAAKLLAQYDSLEEIFADIPNIKGMSLKKKLTEGEEDAYNSRFLATIKTDCPLAADLGPDQGLKPDIEGITNFLQEYNLNSLQRRLPEVFPELQDMQTQLITNIEESNKQSSLPEIKRETITDTDALQNLFKKFRKVKEIALDLETTGLDTSTCEIVGWALSYITPGGKIYSFYIPTSHISSAEIITAAKDLFSEWKGQLFIQNTKYEYKILKRIGLDLPADTLDTMLSSYLENPEQSHGLKSQSMRVFNYQMIEITDLIGEKRSKQISMKDVPLEQIADYACDDAAVTLALGRHYLESLDKGRIKIWKEIESPLAFLLADMEMNGVYIDSSRLKELSIEFGKQINDYQNKILEELTEEHKNLNLKSSQQLAQALIAKGFKLTKKTSSGAYSTDIGVLEKLHNEDETDLIDNIMHYRGLTKLLSTYVESFGELVKENRIHAEFNQALTSTGRLSSSNPNLQNIPIKNPEFASLIRSTFCAEGGKSLICADYSQIELRILAHYTEDPILLEAFSQGQDIHARTASEIFDIPLDSVDSDQRRLGKTLNFALLYQQGVFATAKQLGISYQEAEQFTERYFERFGTIRPFIHETIDKARETGYVETLWGRRRYFRNLNSDNLNIQRAEERAAFNAPIQGSAADLMKIAMLKVNDSIHKLSPEANISLQVHDELVIEIPKDIEDKAIKEITKAMLLDQPLKVPLEIGISAGANWAEAK